MALDLLSLFICASPFLPGSAASGNESFSGDDFTNNLFSDLGPLLALFGENFATQYLSQSYSWWDYILFAMAPLGIITALVSAIRVCGPIWLQALIGRARENLNSAELELMSSVSREVCELWNGDAIVRSMGRPQIKQIIHIPFSKGDVSAASFITLDPNTWSKDPDQKYSLVVTKGEPIDAYNNCFAFPAEETGPVLQPEAEQRADVEAANDGDCNGNYDAESTSGVMPWDLPPNISINSHPGLYALELQLYTLGAIALQAGVLIFAEKVTYSSLKDKLGGPDARDGFILQVIGTVLLTISLTLCAWAIGDSTDETEWSRRPVREIVEQENDLDSDASKDHQDPNVHTQITPISVSIDSGQPEQDDKKPLNIFWIQRRHTTSDQNFEPYLLMPDIGQAYDNGKNNEIEDYKCNNMRYSLTTSHRSTKFMEQKAINPKEISLSQRMKDLFRHPVTTTLTIIRIILSRKSITTVAVIIGLAGFVIQFEGFRLSNWSCTIAQLVATGLLPGAQDLDLISWSISRNKKLPSSPEELSPKLCIFRFNEHKGVPDAKVESKATDQATSPAHTTLEIRARLGFLLRWNSSQFNEALVLTEALNAALRTLNPRFDEAPTGDPCCYVRIKVQAEPTLNDISFTIRKKAECETSWKFDFFEIEAALSLANFALGQEKKGTQPMFNVWKQTLDWYISLYASPLDDIFTVQGRYKKMNGYSVAQMKANLAWWMDSEDNPFSYGKTTPITSFVPAPRWPLALYMFSTFMWAICDRIPSCTLDSSAKCKFVETPEVLRGFSNPYSAMNFEGSTWNSKIPRRPRITQSGLQDMIAHISGVIELGSLTELYLCVLSPLGLRDKLPNEIIIDELQKTTLDLEKKGHWDQVASTYSNLLQVVSKRETMDRFTLRAVAVTVELLIRLAQGPANEWQQKPSHEGANYHLYDENNQQNVIWRLSRQIKNDNTLTRAVSSFEPLYQKQKRLGEYQMIFKDWAGENTPKREIWNSYETQFLFQGAKDVLGWTEAFYEALQEDKTVSLPWEGVSNCVDISGRTILHYIAAYGNISTIDEWRSRWKWKNNWYQILFREDRNGQNPLHYAAMHGKWEAATVILSFLTFKEHRDRDGNGRTALSLAAWYGHHKFVETVYEHEASLYREDNWGQSALSLASRNGKLCIVDYLLKFKDEGVDKIDLPDNWGRTPLGWAAMNGHLEIVIALHKAGADFECPDACGVSPISSAAKNGFEAVAKFLGGVGANVHMVDDCDMNALSWAAQGKHWTIVEWLLANFETINPNYPRTVNDYSRPLSLAIEGQRPDIVRSLLKKGAEVDYQTGDMGLGALHWAVLLEDVELVKLLVSYGADVNYRSGDGLTPLLKISSGGDVEIAKYLLHQKADVELDFKGYRPLHFAVANDLVNMVKLFLEQGKAFLDPVNEDGETPLFLAISDEVKKLLLDAGADPQLMSTKGPGIKNKPFAKPIFLEDVSFSTSNTFN
ncbi:hypothetical protein EG329_001552 [Mollisiaceae sp. DMI_Dod_QoI]|nr:hypothetical protein EG329_001552 [Helotiales sp. DMI_Dod_QoI]